MIAYYLQIKSVHVHLALISIAFFALRGGLALCGASWPRKAWVRYTSYGLDTCLLTSAAMLLAMLKGAAFAHGWLLMKLILLLVYIVLGIVAMRPGLARPTRITCYLAALAVASQIYAIARSHSPWGWLAWLG